MKRTWLLFFFCSLVFILNSPYGTPKTSFEDIESRYTLGYQAALDSSVKIFQLYETGGISVCSGTVIRNDEKTVVLTAKHCIDPMSVEIYADGVQVKNYGISKKYDLAWLFLETNIVGKRSVQFASQNLRFGDYVFILAYPPEHNPYVDVGRMKLKTFKYYYAQLEVIGGCSGGGIFNLDGELVGVVWGSVSDLAIFTPLHDVKNILDQNNIRYQESEESWK